MTRYQGYFWTALSALCWLAYFTVTLGIPVGGEAPSILTHSIAILAGIFLLLAILLAGERPSWPGTARGAMFGAGLVIIILAYVFNLNAPAYRGIMALGLMAIAVPVGYWVGNQMEKITNLIPIAVAFTCADIFSVFQGPSSKAVEDIQSYGTEVAARTEAAMANVPPEEALQAAREAAASIRAPLADYIVVQFPIPGTGASVPVLGMGDFVIMALLFRVAWIHGISPVGVFVSGIISIFVALVVSGLLNMAIPALPFIAVGVIGYLLVAYPRLRRLDRQEIMLSIGVAVLFSALTAARYFNALPR